jgi:hypothetical protein
MKLTIVTAAAVLTAAALSTAANAEINWGPVKNGNQCWTYSFGSAHNEYGFWGPCPAPAAVSAAATAAHHTHHHKKS